MFEDLAALLFASRDYAHRSHLRTGSYAQHKALNEFYDELTNSLDRLIEAYQGRHAVVDLPMIDVPTNLNCVQVLSEHLKIIEAVRDEAVGDDRPLQNLVDDICVTYLQTLYKLKTLN